jgi:hypothetical protein
MTNCSCFVCRINSPHSSAGLVVARRPVHTLFLGTILVCREHRKSSFCGLCLREAPPLESETDYNLVSCVENEDEETWPGVDATCRACRSEWLWRRVSTNPKDRDAVGGPKWNSPDWETRQAIEAFIEMGEGSISDVITLAQEKRWLRNNTKLPDMLSQALAASRFATREEGLGGPGGYGSEEELSEDDVDDEEDPELMSLTEDAGGVRDLAISDWARNRILDGHWFSPADQWYGYSVPNRSTVVHAVHPCPWNRDATYRGAAELDDAEVEVDADGEEVHPRPSTVRADVPPTFQLCEQAYVAYQKQMRMILLPAMSNIVRRVVMECEADCTDPIKRVARMDSEEIIAELRDEAVWYNGIDWLERRANCRRDILDRSRREAERKAKDNGDDSSASSKSDESHTTSPVLSTSTLQTTPSPPPSDGHKDEELVLPGGAGRTTAIPVSPVLESPVLLHPIPYVPITVSHMPHYSLEAFKMVSVLMMCISVLALTVTFQVWREACTPLYQCRCRICERAMLHSNNNGSVAIKQVPSQNVPEKPVEISLNELPPAAYTDDEEEEEEEEEEYSEYDREALLAKLSSATAALKRRLESINALKSKKRGLEELCQVLTGDIGHDVARSRGGTPPKRARRDGGVTLKLDTGSPQPRLTKRRSEEVEDGLVAKEALNKRAKVDDGGDAEPSEGELSPPPTSITGTDSTLPSVENPDEPPTHDDPELEVTAAVRRVLRPRPHSYSSHPRSLNVAPHTRTRDAVVPLSTGVCEADLDQLYTFEAEVDA